MEIRQLRTSVHVEELGSITLAAERLNIARPAPTRQIRAFEDELDGRLFHRHGQMTASEIALLCDGGRWPGARSTAHDDIVLPCQSA